MDSLINYLIPAPASTLLTLASGISMAFVFDRLGKIVFEKDDPIYRAMFFFVGLLLLGWSIWLICLLGLASVLLFQIILYSLIFGAISFFLVTQHRLLLGFNLRRLVIFPKLKSVESYLWVAIAVSLFGYFLLSLSVPTDADSLSYHLALPVDILETGSLWFNKDNLHFRMAGFGEMINLLGVANGCPQLGSFLQVIALIYFLTAVTNKQTSHQKLNLMVLLLGIPTLLFLIPSQKHQLTGISATSLCFLFLSRSARFNTSDTLLWLLVLLFAAGIKYSFFISAFSLIIFFLSKYPQKSSVIWFCTSLFILSTTILGPQLLFRWYHFGDPLSPLLENFMTVPDGVVVRLYTYIKVYRESALTFPLGLLLTNSIGKFSTILGISALILCFVPFLYRPHKAEIITICLLFALILVGGQISSRFFMEPLFWAIPLFVAGYKSDFWSKCLMICARVQLLFVVPLILTGIFFLVPSIFSNKLRHMVLSRSANGYTENLWIDKVLPKGAIIASTNKSRAFFTRNYVPWEYLMFTSSADKQQSDTLYKKLVNEYKITHLVLPYHGSEDLKRKYADKVVYGPKKFLIATRNPFNSREYEIAVYKVKVLSPSKQNN